VILPSLGRAARVGEEPLLSFVEWPDRDGAPQLLLAPIRAPEADDPSPLGAWIRALQASRRERERVRLLYVAATRARAALYLLGSLDATRGGVPAPRPGALLASLWPALGLEFPGDPEGSGAAAEADAGIPGGAEAAPQRLRRVREPWRAPTLAPRFALGGALPLASAELPEAEEVSLRAAPATRHVGAVVHAELERLAGSVPQARAISSPDARARHRALLAALGVPPAELEAMAALVGAALERVLDDPQGRWLLDPSHRDASTALALSGIHDGRYGSVRVDRSFVDADGARWLVDYRVSPHQGADLEAFIAAEVARHEPRLRRSAALARALGPEPVRLAVYFPMLPRLVELPPRAD